MRLESARAPLAVGQINRYVSDLGLGKLNDLPSAVSLNIHVHRDRSVSDLHHPRPETYDVAHDHRPVELHAVHRHRNDGLVGPARVPDLMACAHRPGLVDVAQHDAAENRPVGVRIAGHHHDLDRKIPPIELWLGPASQALSCLLFLLASVLFHLLLRFLTERCANSLTRCGIRSLFSRQI